MKRILSGMRPTGALHLGHYLGVIHNWLDLQRQGHECYFFCADWHALTTEYADPSHIRSSSLDMIRDWLAAGVDPEKAVLFRQSDVPEHAELYLLLSMLIPVPWLERVPSYKDLIENLQHKELNTHGFLGYPLLQSADILIYQANLVPVGEDQLAHLELTREVARRFHHFYNSDVFVEPQPQLTKSPKVPGTDGRKMSKSYDNAIFLSDSEDEVNNKTKRMVTDPGRIRRDDPGNPDVCDVFTLHQSVTEKGTIEQIRTECKNAQIGCVQCKGILADSVNQLLDPMRIRRAEYTDEKVIELLQDGAATARIKAQVTMEKVRPLMGIEQL